MNGPRDFLVRPFVGSHYQNSTYYNGNNGYMAGWFLNYKFKLSKKKFSLSQWHEFEFSRAKEHYQLSNGTPIGDGRSSGLNGSVFMYWHPNSSIITGLQYRYSYYKLGFATYQSAIIYTLKYNF